MSKSKYVIVVGCGRLGRLLAEYLSHQGDSVVAVDRDESVFEKLSPDFTGFRLQGDATRVAVLRQAKMDKADIVIATTRNDNVNLMVVQVAKNVFNVPRVMARLYDPKRGEMYGDMDIEIVCPVKVAAEQFMAWLDCRKD